MSCARSISFRIPGKNGIDVLVTAVESNGNIEFSIEVLGSPLGSADLRGLFFHFNEAYLTSLNIIPGTALIAGSQIKANSIITLGQDVTMSGHANPFDVGIVFGTPGKAKDNVTGPLTFTLDAAQDLTLDDFAHLQFGARLTSIADKITAIAPAAPKAVDDAFNIFEDGAGGLDDPSTTPTGIKFEVLANDTDADGDNLSVSNFEGAQHGTVTIVDGNDADLLPGDAILYTPFEDYSGTDAFTYCVSDGNGGQDSAEVTVTVAAVADIPTLTYSVTPGATVNKIILSVTATQTDLDSSEFIDRLDWSVAGGIPAGVTITPIGAFPGGQPDQVVQQFELTLPLDQDTKFDLSVTAVAKEVSNGDEQAATISIPIEMDFTRNETSLSFQTSDQNIWAEGDAFKFEDNRFIGVDEDFDLSVPFFIPPNPVPFIAVAEGNLTAGFQSHLYLSGGEIDATLPFDVTVDTNYNKTTDSLLIDATSALATGGTFSTTGPEGFYKLAFLFDFFLKAGIEFPVDLTAELGPWTVNEDLIDFDSADAKYSLPLPIPGAELTIEWPHISTNGAQSGATTLTSSGTSNNFLDISLDVDQFAGSIFAPILALDPVPTSEDNFEWLDLDINGGLNFVQEFILSASGMTGTITFENGSTQAFNFFSDLLIQNASSLDADKDDQIEFVLSLTPDATLTNSTDLGLNIGYSFDLLKNIPIVDETLLHLDGNATIPAVEVYNDTFALAGFSSQQYDFFA